MSGDLRQLIHEVLNEELAAFRGGSGAVSAPEKKIETVTMSSDADLAAFARRILMLSRDGKVRADIEAGRYQFHLNQGSQFHEPRGVKTTSGLVPRSTSASTNFATGLITESEIKKLPDGISSIQAGKSVCFTPLAKDELRKRGIKVERTSS